MGSSRLRGRLAIAIFTSLRLPPSHPAHNPGEVRNQGLDRRSIVAVDPSIAE
jgi:hypothetical protein